MKMSVTYINSFSYIGARARNEDSVFPSPDSISGTEQVFVVCDGMGGYGNGDVVSQAVCRALSELNSRTELTEKDITAALNAVRNDLNERFNPIEHPNAGTTIAMVALSGQGAMVMHLGDSRVYHIRTTADKKILHKTRDHSLLMDLLENGDITQEQLKAHPRRHVITKAFMPFKNSFETPVIGHIKDIQAGDYFFVCSDGVWENMDDDELVALLCESTNNKEKMQHITEKCKHARDNYSGCLVQV